MKQLIRWIQASQRLPRDEQGSAMLLVGLGVFMLLTAVGATIDMGRVQIVQSRMSSALDAAGLAAGSVISTTNPTTEATKYFYANFPTGYMGTTINNLTVTPNGDNSILALHVDGTVSTTFMKLVGITSVAVMANSQITRASKGMELVLVIDNTGSMSETAGGSTTKLQAAKTASVTLLNTLYGATTDTVSNLWVGVVPFSQTVNIGTGRSSWTSTATLNWGPTSWGGCVEARGATNRDVTDDPPSVELFKKYYYACDADTDGSGSDTATNAWYGTNNSATSGSSGTNPKWGNCTLSGSTTYRSPLNNTSLGPNYYCPQPLLPMMASKNAIINSVNAMQAVGGTELPTGLSWGWRMLSPRWRGLWGGEMNLNSLPLDYNTPLMYKVMVFMTDGNNDISYNVYSAYGYPNSGQLGGGSACSGSNCTTGETTLSNRTTQLCTSMKAQGVIIYTVALGTSITTANQTLLRNCATKPEYYFLSPTTAALQTSFAQIGDSLANLRISQ